jgi:hypothetical protein
MPAPCPLAITAACLLLSIAFIIPTFIPSNVLTNELD